MSDTKSLPTDRKQLLDSLAGGNPYDVIVIGGGATGLGVALDAVLRGLSVALLESHDFAKGTSSRATKLVHGGVRYLAQGNIGLVTQALHERAAILHNAPHLAGALPFVVPAYRFWEGPYYGAGLKMYDVLAGSASLGKTQLLGAAATRRCLPGVNSRHLKGGILYWDAQFDDARLALALARTAAAQGAMLLNYTPVTQLLYDNGRIAGVACHDAESGQQFQLHAKCVINATGVWVDGLREHDARCAGREANSVVMPSQGIHLVVDRDFLPADHALLAPSTRDGRVLFAVPWLGKLVLGTTDTPTPDISYEPRPLAEEVNFILAEAANYLARPPTRADVKSIWAGLRPLVKPSEDKTDHLATRRISREHTVLISPTGLVTVTGGKWTTYRVMAEDVLEKSAAAGLIAPARLGASRTARFRLLGAPPVEAVRPNRLWQQPGLAAYGTEQGAVQALPGADVRLAMGLTEAMVRFAARHEYARTVEDVLARRSRLLFLDAILAESVASRVAQILHEEIDADSKLPDFLDLARRYRCIPDG